LTKIGSTSVGLGSHLMSVLCDLRVRLCQHTYLGQMILHQYYSSVIEMLAYGMKRSMLVTRRSGFAVPPVLLSIE